MLTVVTALMKRLSVLMISFRGCIFNI